MYRLYLQHRGYYRKKKQLKLTLLKLHLSYFKTFNEIFVKNSNIAP